jgi:hypothetical protein
MAIACGDYTMVGSPGQEGEATDGIRKTNQGRIFLAQPASAIFGIKALIGLIPGVALILGAIILIWFPLGGRTWRGCRSGSWRCTAKSTRNWSANRADERTGFERYPGQVRGWPERRLRAAIGASR